MARLARLVVPGQLHLIMLHSHGAQPVFRDNADRLAWLEWMAEHAKTERVSVHAYALLDTWVGLLVTPEISEGIPRWMQAVGRKYGRYFNDRYVRRGALWEGRYRCTVVEADRYALPCMVFLDQACVRAGLTALAEQFPWSSHLHYLGHRQDRFLTPLAAYWALGNTPFAREASYAELVRSGLTETQVTRIGEAVDRAWALGESPFVDELQHKVQRRLLKARPGRPPKPAHP